MGLSDASLSFNASAFNYVTGSVSVWCDVLYFVRYRTCLGAAVPIITHIDWFGKHHIMYFSGVSKALRLEKWSSAGFTGHTALGQWTINPTALLQQLCYHLKKWVVWLSFNRLETRLWSTLRQCMLGDGPAPWKGYVGIESRWLVMWHAVSPEQLFVTVVELELRLLHMLHLLLPGKGEAHWSATGCLLYCGTEAGCAWRC